MRKPIVVIAAGVFVLWMGIRSIAGYDADIEHLYAGQTVTVTCRDGKPYEGEGLHMHAALEKCAEARSKQQGAVRIFLGVGVVLIGWGTLDLRKARAG